MGRAIAPRKRSSIRCAATVTRVEGTTRKPPGCGAGRPRGALDPRHGPNTPSGPGAVVRWPRRRAGPQWTGGTRETGRNDPNTSDSVRGAVQPVTTRPQRPAEPRAGAAGPADRHNPHRAHATRGPGWGGRARGHVCRRARRSPDRSVRTAAREEGLGGPLGSAARAATIRATVSRHCGCDLWTRSGRTRTARGDMIVVCSADAVGVGVPHGWDAATGGTDGPDSVGTGTPTHPDASRSHALRAQGVRTGPQRRAE